jgi:NADH-quinone oxidoreductase subunit K
MIGLQHYLVSSILFVLGVLGIFLNRKNVIIILMAIELILLSGEHQSRRLLAFWAILTGQVFACSC